MYVLKLSHLAYAHGHIFDSMNTKTFHIGLTHFYFALQTHAHIHKFTGYKSLNVVKVQQIRTVLFVLFTGIMEEGVVSAKLQS